MTRWISSHFQHHRLPLVLQPGKKLSKKGFFKLLADEGDYLRERLLDEGGVLFRGFPIEDETDFASVIETLNLGVSVDYIGGDSPRTKVKGGVYTSTEAPPSIKIPLHNELSFVKRHPKHIYFFCQEAPTNGGETILADARKVYQNINPEVKQRFIEKGIKYTSCYYFQSPLMDLVNRLQRSHKTWIDVFETTDKAEVEEKCRQNDFAFQWNQNDWLQISQTRPAVTSHPLTGETVWFNQAHLYDFNPKLLGTWRYLAAKALYIRKHMRLHEVSHADETPIARSDLYHVMETLDQSTIAFPWKKGDLLILDNVLCMHGRAVFIGKRRVLAAMTG